MLANSDFVEMLQLLNEENVDYMVVGATACSYYSEPRYTKDVDVWVGTEKANSEKVYSVLKKFHAPVSHLTPKDFAEPDTVYQMGVPPHRIDLITTIDGVEFSSAMKSSRMIKLNGIPARIIGKPDLIINKRASGRPQDLLDLEKLLDPRYDHSDD